MSKADMVILGEGCMYSTDSEITGLNNNVIVCGGSGSGKTMSISEPRFLKTENSSLIAVVTKRRVVDMYRPLFESRGYQVMDLNYADPLTSNVGYDPLSNVKDVRDITGLAGTLVRLSPGGGTKADPYWDEAATSLLSAEIAYIMSKMREPNLAAVADWHRRIGLDLQKFNSTGEDQLATWTAYDNLSDFGYAGFAKSCFTTFALNAKNTRSCIYSSLNTAIDKVLSPEILELSKKRAKVQFEELGQRKTVLFVTTSPVNLSLQRYLNLFYADAIRQLFEYAERLPDRTLPVPVHLLCDDFATGGKIPDFEDYISIFREKNISVTLLLQSESQLKAMYGHNEAVTIINNCDSYVYMGGMDMDTSQNVSRRLDVPLTDVLNMPVGEMVLFRRGQKPVVTSRYDIRSNPLYQQVLGRYEETIGKGRGNHPENRSGQNRRTGGPEVIIGPVRSERKSRRAV